MLFKTAMYLFLMLVLFGCSCRESIPAYRYNAFQFIYPEHYLKADITNVPSSGASDENTATLEFFGLHAVLPSRWRELVQSRVLKGDKVICKSRGEVVIISLEKETKLDCEFQEFREANKDFCSAFNSINDFYLKLFTLTPDIVLTRKPSITGEQWLVHKKGYYFELVKSIKIYQGDEVTVYRSDLKPGHSVKTNLIIFHKKLRPNYLLVSTTFDDEEALNSLIASKP
jgi:hypothetical protein